MDRVTNWKEFGLKFSADKFKQVGWEGFLEETNALFEGGAAKLSQSAAGLWSTIKGGIGTAFQNSGVGALEKLKPQLERFGKWLESGGFKSLEDVATNFITKIVNGFIWLVDQGKILIPVIDKIKKVVVPVFEVISEFITTNKDAIPIIKGIVAALLLIGGAIGIISIITSIGTGLAFLLSPLGLITVAVGILYAAWTNNWGGMRDKVMTIWEQIKVAGIIIFGFLLAFWTSWGDRVLGFFSTLWDIIKIVVVGALEIIGNVIAFGLNLITGNWQKAWYNIKSIAETAWNVISGIFDSITSFFSGKKTIDVKVNRDFNDRTRQLADDLKYSEKAGRIPQFATGTNFAPGGAALVGEEGPELVNLPRGSQVLPANKTKEILSSSGSINAQSGAKKVQINNLFGSVTVKNEADEDRLVRKTIKAIKKLIDEELDTGGGVLAID
ncbi:hypothetical protein P6N53_07820 [Desulforamulus aquiferis]|uniref:Phage tail tape measure protein n=2 Tax=Desulforamulus aquiferis TaxID=1397668 RepID=A0AAW7ZCL1_9FIRM|nr:hypothetical protein [Desulforamulus aquiferis]